VPGVASATEQDPRWFAASLAAVAPAVHPFRLVASAFLATRRSACDRALSPHSTVRLLQSAGLVVPDRRGWSTLPAAAEIRAFAAPIQGFPSPEAFWHFCAPSARAAAFAAPAAVVSRETIVQQTPLQTAKHRAVLSS